MKSALLAVAAGALVGNAAANVHERHQGFHNRRGFAPMAENETCGCTTYVSTFYGEPTLIQPMGTPSSMATPNTPLMPGSPNTPASSVMAASSTPAAAVPTPVVTTFATPGTYTVPATTLTVTDTTTVCGATTASLTPGVNTYGGVTTSVSTATTVTCPYATVETSGSTTTSVIRETTYYCPYSGVHTIGATTTSVATDTVTVCPVATSYAPGTYTAPEQTVTVTKTNDIYYCPYESAGATSSIFSTPTPVYTPSSAALGASSTPMATPASPAVAVASGSPSSGSTIYLDETTTLASTFTSTPAATGSTIYIDTTTSLASTYTSTAASASSTAANGMTTNGKQWAMTYTPYTSSGDCKDKDTVMADVKDIKQKGFTTLRLYSTDCSGLVNIGAAASEYGLKLIIGIYIDSTGVSASATTDQVTEVISWGKEGSNWDLVDLIIVGNEAIFNGYCTAAELGSFIASIRTEISAASLDVKLLTTTEPLNILQEQADQYLCEHIDVLGVNVQAFFTSSVAAADAGDFINNQLDLTLEVCPSYPDITEAYNLESGWPHQSTTNNVLAVAGVSEQATALASILEKAGTRSAIFAYADDEWKSAGEYGVEQYFGCADQFTIVSGEVKIGEISVGASLSVSSSSGIDLDLNVSL
ncbi:glycoside hydrolase family 17 protein [Saccharata proteae CBS 121410]|uniref:Probable beta-glucosidase btgE n=1 Tax=Saccharata proteae CBS 121410 TaxID=1314787 RepID=A0A9P4LZN0_9PEZI|nr:glycoside hydrolase family 17 protein [Saccharata proteae CBS 121410]